eukprot:748641-Pyramimonas_sp.AAC.1
MSNTDIKILAGAMSIFLAAHVSQVVSSDQKCLKHRGMIANTVEAEAGSLEQHVLANEQARLLLTDFCAAFPSLAIPLLLHVL